MPKKKLLSNLIKNTFKRHGTRLCRTGSLLNYYKQVDSLLEVRTIQNSVFKSYCFGESTRIIARKFNMSVEDVEKVLKKITHESGVKFSDVRSIHESARGELLKYTKNLKKSREEGWTKKRVIDAQEKAKQEKKAKTVQKQSYLAKKNHAEFMAWLKSESKKREGQK
ncbi:MAG: hypothetical protein WC915_05025 [archaeon]|jgi:hypothetical protein